MSRMMRKYTTTTMERGMSEVWKGLQDALSPYDRAPSDVQPRVGYVPDDGEPRGIPLHKLVSTDHPLTHLYNRLRDQAIAKNRAYGDSALHPIGLFGSGRAKDAIGARIDDKLSRFKNHHGAFGENDVEDLIGYLVLWLLADEDEKRAE